MGLSRSLLPAVLAACLASSASALNKLPKVKAVQVSNCSAFPNYDASTGSAGQWSPFVVNSNSSAEGYGDSVQIVFTGANEVQEVRITITDNNQLAKYPFRCDPSANTTSGYQLSAYTPEGVSGYGFNPINLTPYPYDAEMIWGVEGPQIQGYYHYIKGKKQDGVYLGSNGVTKWGIEYVADGGPPTGQPYWTLRLLGPHSKVPPGTKNATATYPDEYETFIQVLG